jgi:hypothetical protein
VDEIQELKTIFYAFFVNEYKEHAELQTDKTHYYLKVNYSDEDSGDPRRPQQEP